MLPENDALCSNEKSDKLFLILWAGLLDLNFEKLQIQRSFFQVTISQTCHLGDLAILQFWSLVIWKACALTNWTISGSADTFSRSEGLIVLQFHDVSYLTSSSIEIFIFRSRNLAILQFGGQADSRACRFDIWQCLVSMCNPRANGLKSHSKHLMLEGKWV